MGIELFNGSEGIEPQEELQKQNARTISPNFMRFDYKSRIAEDKFNTVCTASDEKCDWLIFFPLTATQQHTTPPPHSHPSTHHAHNAQHATHMACTTQSQHIMS
jgi:hypothetical protein